MAEVLGTWAGLDRRVGAVRRWLLDKPEMEPEALAEVRARLERVLATLVADGRVRIERPRAVDDLRSLLAEIDRRAALPGSQARHDVASRLCQAGGGINQGNRRNFATSASSGPITRSFRSTSNWAGFS
jgi:hypothetical protein